MERSEEKGDRRTVRVWDPGVRLFHWTLLVLVVCSWVTGKEGGSWMTYHMWSGYAILALVLFRLAWGFVGGGAARFAAFVRGPRAVLAYACTLGARRAVPHATHNPLGALSVLALLLCLLMQAGTGLFANDDIVTEGPLYKWVSKETSDFLTTLHNYNFEVLLVLVGLHLAAVFFYLFYKRENLILPMITGRKSLPPAVAEPAPAGLGRAVVVLAASAAIVYGILKI